MTGTLVAIKNLKFAQIQNNIYVFVNRQILVMKIKY